MKFKEWFENYEMEPVYQLRGEYWIEEGGEVMGDMENGDYNHEGYAMNRVQGEIMDEFGVYADSDFIDWDGESKQQILQEILDDENEQTRAKFQQMIEDGEEDEVILMKMRESDPEGADEKMAMANGFGDARMYAIMKWGWKRIAGNDIESASLTPHDMQVIARGIYDIENNVADDAEFYISVYGGKSYEVTLAELEAGKLNTEESPERPDIVSTGVPQPNASQGWEQRRRQREKQYDTLRSAASKQVRDMELKNLHPYYQKRTFPFGDWTIH